MGQSNYVHLEGCNIHAVTDAAILVEFDLSDDAAVVEWFPKSQVADADDFEKGDRDVTVSITEWIAKQKGIEVEE